MDYSGAAKGNRNRIVGFSEADREALHVQLADEAYCIGPKASKDSYLNVTNIISIAKKTGCDALAPNRFLAENANFAELCRECNVIIIGPSPTEAISKMGTKEECQQGKRCEKREYRSCQDLQELLKTQMKRLLLLKNLAIQSLFRTAGGGGKGIRVARTEEELLNGVRKLFSRRSISIGNSGVYIQNCLEDFRHVEIQVMGDTHGNAIHFGERDCSNSKTSSKACRRNSICQQLTQRCVRKWEEPQLKPLLPLITLEQVRLAHS